MMEQLDCFNLSYINYNWGNDFTNYFVTLLVGLNKTNSPCNEILNYEEFSIVLPQLPLFQAT